MQFTITPSYLICFAIGFLIALLIARLIAKRTSDKESFLSRIFQSNKDLDTTIGLIIGGFLVWTCIMHFQDGIQGSEAGYIVLGGLNGFFALAGYKKGLEHGQATATGNNGHSPSKPT